MSCLPGPPASRRRPQASLARGPGALGEAPRVDTAAGRRALSSLGAPVSASGKFSWGTEGAAPRSLKHAVVPWVYFLFFKKNGIQGKPGGLTGGARLYSRPSLSKPPSCFGVKSSFYIQSVICAPSAQSVICTPST